MKIIINLTDARLSGITAGSSVHTTGIQLFYPMLGILIVPTRDQPTIYITSSGIVNVDENLPSKQ